jgi:outer membrane autotransporter protein
VGSLRYPSGKCGFTAKSLFLLAVGFFSVAAAAQEVPPPVGLEASPGAVNFDSLGPNVVGGERFTGVQILSLGPPPASASGVNYVLNIPSLSPPFGVTSVSCPQGTSSGIYGSACDLSVSFSPTSVGPASTQVAIPYSVFWSSEEGTNFEEQGVVQISLSGTGTITDSDDDGVADGDDICPMTPLGEAADASGCSPSQRDDDNDDVSNLDDQCPNTPSGESADSSGCSESQLDDDADDDGILDDVDQCPMTPIGESADDSGCGPSQLDDDEDGVVNSVDQCPNTPAGEVANRSGCSPSQLDDDNDGVVNTEDRCAITPAGVPVDTIGCSDAQQGQLDDDEDGVVNAIDACPDTAAGVAVDDLGCALEPTDPNEPVDPVDPMVPDEDADGVEDAVDQCPSTPTDESADGTGCAATQLDDDDDGVSNAVDQCPMTGSGQSVDAVGCSTAQTDSDGDSVSDAVDQCPNTPTGETADPSGCAPSQLDADSDGVGDAIDECPETPAGEMPDPRGCSPSQLDTDEDGVSDAVDQCPATPLEEEADAEGCSASQTDSDSDGVADSVDACPNEPGDGADGCPTQDEIEDAFKGYTGGDPTLDQTSTVIADTCISGRASAALQRDCNELADAALGGESGVGTALREITPERATKANAAVRQTHRVQNENIGDRIGAVRSGSRGPSFSGVTAQIGDFQGSLADVSNMLQPLGIGASADEEMQDWKDTRWGFFVSGELIKGDRDATVQESGFDYETSVLTTGVDYRISDRFILGGALSFADGETEVDASKGDLDAEGNSMTLYGTYFLDNIYVDFSVSRGSTDYEQTRVIQYDLGNGVGVNQSFNSDYSGDTTSGFVGAGIDLIQTQWNVSLRATLDYLDSELDGFSETAAFASQRGSGWGVALGKQEQDWLTGTLTGSVTYIVQQQWGILAPYVEVDIVQEFSNDQRTVTGRFVGDLDSLDLTVVTDDPDSSYFRVRAGASAQMPGGFSAFADYGRLFSFDNWSEYTVSAGFRLEF